jgi:hypothetical protein
LNQNSTAFDFFKFENPVDPKYAEATWIADNWITYVPQNSSAAVFDDY